MPGKKLLRQCHARFISQVDYGSYTKIIGHIIHSFHHQNNNSLGQQIGISRECTCQIIKTCTECPQFLPVPHNGVNTWGFIPNQLWQMDVTHISSFGRLQYLHVSIDTCSGIMFATPLTGEKASHVIQHCLDAWSAWGKPKLLKTA